MGAVAVPSLVLKLTVVSKPLITLRVTVTSTVTVPALPSTTSAVEGTLTVGGKSSFVMVILAVEPSMVALVAEDRVKPLYQNGLQI